ncbi:MAG: ATP-dependent helicase HrpB [Cyanobacteria bacterium PR.023]|nr:ATP-dependent helicase HrpB [Cyanobacteria bacterium PR.023]
MKHLPIDDVLPEVISNLANSDSGALVLIAAPGAGKTTRVPTAVLDAGLAELNSGSQQRAGQGNGSESIRPGQIIVLQPRRVAARAAATRISDERGTKLGEEIGYQVRHESKVSARTRIVICTEGVFLRKLQKDPMLENIAVVIFDEFHERNLDSDLALALVRQVRNELRPDLKIIVMSATLDAEPVSRYLSNCPVLQSPGRTYPVNIEYLASQPAASNIEQTVNDGVKKMLAKSDGHILAFLPGVGEIRKTQELLEAIAERENLLLLPLYGDLPLEEQQRVLNASSQRKVVLATNIAETSLTIDGITAVVDSGMARVNRLDPRLGLNRLGLERISQASADQRAGRAGRTASGDCLRLWTEREHKSMAAFSPPEIERVDLSECALQLLAWGEKDLQSFAWFQAPPPASLNRALELLDRLDAIENGRLTELGRKMAQLPLQPRLARLLVEGAESGQIKDTALCAALLSERDPLKRSTENTGAKHKSESDVMDRVWALNEFAEQGHKHSFAGELMVNPAKQILRAADQLTKLLGEFKSNDSERKNNHRESSGKDQANKANKLDEKKAEEAVMRAIMVAFVDRICRRREPGGKTAVMVGGRGVRLAIDSAVSDAELFVAVELLETGQSDATVRQASAIDKSWLPKSHLSTSVDVFYDSAREKVVASKCTRFCDLIIEEKVSALPTDIDPGEILAKALSAANIDLAALVDDQAKQYLARINCLRDNMPELELPQFSSEPWRELLPLWCMGASSLTELKSNSFIAILQSQLSHEQLTAIEQEAPAQIAVPSGNQIKLIYENGKAPVLAVRIQELFGMTETPRIARARQPVLMHLLAPNYRVQQITPDLASFWKNTYGEVKKDLKARYPKHSWPDNPLTAQAESRPKRKA